MPHTREYNKKIASLKNMRRITSAMKMISATKLQRTQRSMNALLPYNRQMLKVMRHLSSIEHQANELLLTGYDEPRSVLILLITSDRGLCGSCNSNAIKIALELAEEVKSKGQEVSFSFIGARGRSYFARRGYTIVDSHTGMANNPSFEQIEPIAEDLLGRFRTGAYHEVWLVYNRFHSALSQRPCVEQLLPVTGDWVAGDEEKAGTSEKKTDYILEPEAGSLLGALLPKFAKFQLYHAVVQAATSEHAARMAAMDSATGNCETLSDKYVMLRNRARQAAITTELTEILSAKEAL